MNKVTIAKSAVSYWDENYQQYIVESPLFAGCTGVGDTEEEARQIFDDLLSDAYQAYLEGRVPGYARPGRPAKGAVPFNSNIKPESKELIQRLADEIGCSLGEAVDYLSFHYKVRGVQHANVEHSFKKGAGRVVAEPRSSYRGRKKLTLAVLATRLEALEAKVQSIALRRKLK
jgi:predicted RNase H-like HicB family nuclease